MATAWASLSEHFSLREGTFLSLIRALAGSLTLTFHILYYFFLDRHNVKLSGIQTKFKTRMMGEGGLGGADLKRRKPTQ